MDISSANREVVDLPVFRSGFIHPNCRILSSANGIPEATKGMIHIDITERVIFHHVQYEVAFRETNTGMKAEALSESCCCLLRQRLRTHGILFSLQRCLGSHSEKVVFPPYGIQETHSQF